MKKYKVMILSCLVGILLAALLTGCGSKSNKSMVKGSRIAGDVVAEKETSTTEEIEQEELYRIDEIDQQEDMIRFENISTGQLERYTYNSSTYIYDKNEISTTIDSLYCGQIVTFEINDNSQLLKSVKESDALWNLSEVKEFSIDVAEGLLTIGKSQYYLTDASRIYQDGNRISLENISNSDTLRVIGDEKQIVSIVVVSGHGTIRLTNTDLFDGGWITVGRLISKQVTKDMEIEIAAGQYTLALAHKGYGDATQIEVKSGEVTVVDCNQLKGNGPQYGKVTFSIPYDGAKLYINGKETSYKKGISLQYGAYSIQVKAEGYATWSRTLMVASKEAKIGVVLSEESDSDSETSSDSDSSSSDNTATAGSKAGSLAGSKAGSSASSSSSTSSSTSTNSSSSSNTDSSSSGSTSDSSSTSTISDDTLSTLSDLVSKLTNTSDDD